jgi:hypothetical protein
MKILYWEILGIIFIICVGSALHFVFELSGYWKPVGLIAAVNESVWEHLKLGFWPAVFFALIEYPFLKKTGNFVIAKAVSIYLIPFGIAALFYSYTFILGHNTLAMDVLIFVFAVVMGQVASYRIMTASELPQKLNATALLAVVALAVLFMVFTFYPPHVSLFEDTVTGGYGILQ